MIDGINKTLGWNWSPSQWAAAQARYDRQIIEQHGKIRIFGQTTPKPLTAVFTDVYVLDTPTAHRRFSHEELAEYLREMDRSRSFRHGERNPVEDLLNQGTKFIIMGKPGAGKTTLLRHLALREAQPGLTGYSLRKVPIFVALKQFANARKPLLDFIVEQFEVCRFPDAAPYVAEMLESGSALVLFDGLDEVMRGEEAQPDQRGQIADELERFALRYSDCHVVISTRIAAINYTFHPEFTYLELADFAQDQVTQFVRHWFMNEAKPDESTALADRMIDELAKGEHEGIRDLARSPLLLALLCLNFAKTRRFPIRRAEIYDEALDVLLKTWDETRQIGRGTRYKELSLGRKRQMFAAIAHDTFVRGQIVFPQADLEASLITHLEHVPGLPDSIDIDREAVLQEIIAQHGIFAQQAHRLYSFSHFTFQEYYTAKYIADDTTGSALASLLEHITDYKWREVTLMVASLSLDATGFLEDFAQALTQLTTDHPNLAATLQQIDKVATDSHAGYNIPATRLFYFGTGAFDTEIEIGAATGDLNRQLELVQARLRDSSIALDLARSLDFDLDSDFALAQAIDSYCLVVSDYKLASAFDLGSDFARVLDLAAEQGRASLHETLASVGIPTIDAESWDGLRYTKEFKWVVEASSELVRYRCLESEAQRTFTRTLIPVWHAPAQARAIQVRKEILLNYLKATRLFYDCIQLANTPDRRAFEERILEPPP